MWFEDPSKDSHSEELFMDWRNSIDTIREFFDACCEPAPTMAVMASDLHKRYLKYCLDQGIEAVSNQTLYKWFEGAGCAKKRGKKNNYIEGVILKKEK